MRTRTPELLHTYASRSRGQLRRVELCLGRYLGPEITEEAEDWEHMSGDQILARAHRGYGVLVGRVFVGVIRSVAIPTPNPRRSEDYLPGLLYPEDKGCLVPPPGWWCSREPGHDGPCAARPDLTGTERARQERRAGR